MKIIKLIKLIKNPYIVIEVLAGYGKLKFLSDRLYVRLVYRARVGKKLNLLNPQSFNEKLQWLKLNYNNPKYISLVDKYEAKKIVAGIIGEQYIIPTIGVYSSFSEIDFEELPEQFVIKCTHDSGGYVICKDKKMLDINEARKKIEKTLRTNYYWSGREWPYKHVVPRIIIEKYMEDENTEDLTDYKLMCFQGKVKCIFTCTERFAGSGLKVTFFDENWVKLPFERHYKSSEKEIERPHNLTKMIELAEKLSNGIPFVRVDFYEINGKIYFGEMTFYPGYGFEEFSPDSWDYILGEWLDISSVHSFE